MSETPPVLPKTEVVLSGDFYVTGGTLRPDAPCYVERKADKELCDCLLNGEFCYVLTSRQMGKSSLMVRTVKRLRQEGVAVAVLDLTAIGQNLTVEQWYDGLVSRLGQQLRLEDELLEFWAAHPEWGPLQRWTSALELVVLQKLSSEVVIFVDEIDIVRSLPFSTDEFFAAIRECYNRRAHEPAFNRLAFGLLGVATPTDLIRDTRMTPFNIGRRIELNDFTPEEAGPLAVGLSADETIARELLARVLYWTGGHPYLTQRLCRALAESAYPASPAGAPPVLPGPQDIDRLAEKLFLSRQARDRDDNLIFVRERILRSETDVAGLLLLYRRVYLGELVADQETNPLVSILHLAGIARGVNGFLQVRNRIYRQVFDFGWIQANMPEAEVRRQKKAGRRGMLLGFGTAAVLLLSYLLLGPVWREYHQEKLAHDTVTRVQELYANLGSYRDTFESRLELGLGGSTVPVTGSGSIRYQAPDKVSLSVKTALNSPETEVRFEKTGPRTMLYLPSQNEYQALMPPREPWLFELPPWLNRHLGPVTILPLYRLLVDPSAARQLVKEARNVQPEGYGEIDGQPVRIVHWEQDARSLLGRVGVHGPAIRDLAVPVTVWVNTSNYVVLQIRVDLSSWAMQFSEQPPEVPISGLVVTEVHRFIQASQAPPAPGAFRPEISPDAKEVERLKLPELNLANLLMPRREFARLIPPRLPYTPANLIDLSAYYNAALAETWHPGTENNTLEMLPTGLLQFGGTVFDVRGIVQLAGKKLRGSGERYPQHITGIRIGQSCRELHFLQGTGWPAANGTLVGTFVVHYANGKEETIPIVYGEDVRDWVAASDSSKRLTRGKIVWSGVNEAHFAVRLFKTTWLNPDSGSEIMTLDYNSTLSDAAPFVLAITAEK